MDTSPVQPFQQRRQLRRRQPHHAVFHLRPPAAADSHTSPQPAPARSVPKQQLQFFRLRSRSLSQLAAPAEQLLRRQPMAPSYRTDRVTTRHDLRDNPRLVLMAPLPPATGSGENLQPPNRLRDSNMFSVHSKPNGQNQTEDSA